MTWVIRMLLLSLGDAFLVVWAMSDDAPRWFVVAGVWGVVLWALITTESVARRGA